MADSSRLVNLDGSQIDRATATVLPNGDYAQKVTVLSGLVPGSYDSVELTYVASGNGAGEVETATYKVNGSVTTTLTMVYDSSNRLASVTRS